MGIQPMGFVTLGLLHHGLEYCSTSTPAIGVEVVMFFGLGQSFSSCDVLAQ
jgi:hypothetical protein